MCLLEASYMVQVYVFLFKLLDLPISTFTQNCVDSYWVRGVTCIKTWMNQTANLCLHYPLMIG